MKHKHNWQLLNYGQRAGYIGTVTDMIVLMVCRDCNEVLEQKVSNELTPKLKVKGKK